MSIVMVPLDGSPFAEQALPLALTIARRIGAHLHVVRVRASLPLSGDDDSEAYVRATAAQIQSRLPAKVRPWVLTDELGALQYPPPAPDAVAKTLAIHAREHADLIVMSTHGRGGVKRAWLGSVADALLRIAPRPVLLVRPGDVTFSLAADADRGITHILIPLDGSETAEHAIPVARELGKPLGARITLLRVTSPLALQLSSDPADGYPLADPTSMGRRAAGHYLNGVAEPLRREGLTVDVRVVEQLSPAPAIVDFAKKHAVDLVVLTTTGGGSIRRVLLGSVADHVIRKGETPVLVCNTRHADSAAVDASPAAATGIDLEC
jgi:nucleotide-binding universal stress UspA family protein